ncbi:hypothetical protein GQQ13_10990 [Pantoea agglomerans]|nr:hypothetical protein [Pantoea agglomerans]
MKRGTPSHRCKVSQHSWPAG